MNWKQLLSIDTKRARSRIKASDIRSDFDKDYHRIISSPSFRRLQDKTQAFPLEENDFVRTRLTHSLEVSSFGKSLGQYLGKKIIEDKIDKINKGDLNKFWKSYRESLKKIKKNFKKSQYSFMCVKETFDVVAVCVFYTFICLIDGGR